MTGEYIGQLVSAATVPLIIAIGAAAHVALGRRAERPPGWALRVWLRWWFIGAVVLYGADGGHLFEAIAHGDTVPGNAGGIVIYDLVIPAVALGLVLRERRASRPEVPGRMA